MGLQSDAELMTPLHVHGARTEAEYRALHRQAIANGRASRPALNWRQPWWAPTGRPAFVSGGKWIVQCDCGNGPSVHPEWRLALCFECGAVYEQVDLPDDRQDIEDTLLARPNAENRHWFRHESVADLQRENEDHGHPPRRPR